jgi:Uma2 family endonuclease
MATAALISASDYLRMSFEHDAEFVHGKIEERPMPDRDHSDLQSQLLLLLSQPQYAAWFLCRTELRVKVAEDTYRIPDLCVLRAGAPREQNVIAPPLLCIEIQSPGDTLPATLLRVREFLGMGVPEVWIFDPRQRTAHLCVGDTVTLQTSGTLTVPGTPASVALAEVFAVLDAA